MREDGVVRAPDLDVCTNIFRLPEYWSGMLPSGS